MYANKGDALLLSALDHALEQRYPGSERVFTSWQSESDSRRYGFTVIDALLAPDTFPMRAAGWVFRRRPSVAGQVFVGLAWVTLGCLSILAALDAISPRLARLLMTQRARVLWDAAHEADHVVAVPGAYLMAARPEHGYWVSQAVTLALPAILNKQVVLAPCSVGPFVPPHDGVARWLLPRFERIVLRETESRPLVRGLGVLDTKMTQAADMAFAYPYRSPARVGKRPVVGVSVRRHYFPGQNAEEGHKNFVRAIAQTVTDVSKDFAIELLPQVLPPAGDDVDVSHEVRRMCHPRADIAVVEDDLDLKALIDRYGEYYAVIGTRMHANLIALCQGVPVIAIAYEHKTRGIMHELSLDDYVVDIEEATGERLTAMWRRLCEDYDEYADHLRTVLPDQQESATSWLKAMP